MPITVQQQAANDRHFRQCIKAKTQMYLWKDNGNAYSMSSGRSVKPATMKGFIELCGITSRNFAKIFIDLPDKCVFPELCGMTMICDAKDVNKEKILDWIEWNRE